MNVKKHQGKVTAIVTGIAFAVTAAFAPAASAQQSVATAMSASYGVAVEAADPAYEQHVQDIAGELNKAKQELAAGESRRVVNEATATDITVTMSESGQLVVEPTEAADGQAGGTMAAADICHAAAMSAVYAIGAAVLAGLALTGGGVVAGVFLGPAVLNAMSVALATGSGLSALVAVYIC